MTSYFTRRLFNISLVGALALGALTVSAQNVRENLLDKLRKTYPNIPFSSVNETPAAGVYEAVFGNDVLYVDASGVYFFPTMVNMLTKTNIGDERRDDLNRVNFDELPLKDAVKVVHGNGSRVMAVFADPNCGYCKKLESVLAGIKDVTIYTFPVGILGPDSVAKVNAINSSSDKTRLWQAVMNEGGRPVLTSTAAGVATTDRNMGLFKRLGFQGTPAVVFLSGASLKGYAEADRIEAMLAKK
jgi:thiol:disulfide interchange protein DsbC